MTLIDQLQGHKAAEVVTADDALDLDIRIVEAGDAVNALLCSTDNGCDTQAGGDC